MRTSFHHQPEAQHPNFPLSVSWQADYPIFWHEAAFRCGAEFRKRSERSGHSEGGGRVSVSRNDPRTCTWPAHWAGFQWLG